MNNNILIAEFMGGYPSEEKLYQGLTPAMFVIPKLGHVQNMRYNNSYDWLMPVVIEIQKKGYVIAIDSPIIFENIYNKVVDFIKWYNENSKTTNS